MNPVISVIIPTYNNEDTIARCLDSVCGQSLKDIEIIVVNDGSADHTRCIVEDYTKTDSRIILINQENTGQGYARNAGIKAARGKYIGFVDADDSVAADMYRLLLDALESNNAQIAQCNIAKPGNENGFLKMRDEAVKISSDRAEYFEKYIYHPIHSYECTNKLIAKDFLTDSGILFCKNDTVFAEDLLFNLDIALVLESIVFVNRPLYFYNERSDSHSSQPHLYKPAKFIALFEVFKIHAQKLGKYDMLKNAIYKTAVLIIMINISEIIPLKNGKSTARLILKRQYIKQYLKNSLNASSSLKQWLLMLLLLYLPLFIKIEFIKRHYSKWN